MPRVFGPILAGMVLVAFLIQLIVAMAVGPIPPRAALRVVTGTVQQISHSGGAKDKWVAAYTIVVTLEDGSRYVGGIGDDSTVSARDRAMLVGKKARLTIDPNRVFAIDVDGRSVMAYDAGRAYWEKDWAGETEFLLLLLGACCIVWGWVGWRHWSSVRKGKGRDSLAPGQPHGVVAQRRQGNPHNRQVLGIAGVILSSAALLALQLYLIGGKRCPGSVALAAIAMLLLWLLLSLLWLIRTVPRDPPLPALIGKPGVMDAVVGLALAACLIFILGARGGCV